MRLIGVALWLAAAGAFAQDGELAPAVTDEAPASAMSQDGIPSEQVERDLQSLSWNQFRSVVEAIPKLKADVDAYGPLGWHYVQRNYRKYAWKKNVDKLDSEQKRRLVELISEARNGAETTAR